MDDKDLTLQVDSSGNVLGDEVLDNDSVNESLSIDYTEPITMLNNNLIYLLSFIIIENGIVIGILLGFIYKGITKK